MPAQPWLGRPARFVLEPTGDPVFDRRLVIPARAGGGWLVLSYGGGLLLPPSRPMIRILCGPERQPLDFVLPGPVQGFAHWVGSIPPDVREIRLAAGPGFVLERVGLRGELGVLVQCLTRRPGHFFAALYARIRGFERRYRDTLRGACAVTPLTGFPAWAAARKRAAPVVPCGLRIRCLIPGAPGDEPAIALTLDALSAQTHAAWTACVAWEGKPSAATGASQVRWDATRHPGDLIADSDALCLLAPGDTPDPEAFARLALALPGADLAYADEIGSDGAPRLKPDWSPDLARATGYVGRARLLSRALVARLPDGAVGPMADAVARLDALAVGLCERAVHVPRVLFASAHLGAADALDPATRARGLDAALAASHSPARAAIRDGVVDLLWPLPEPAPKVSVVIPSRDRLDLIARVCRGILNETAYAPIELIIVDNGSSDPAVLAHYEALRRDVRVRIVAHPQPFNFAAMVNAGVEAASGSVILLLNNDVAILEPGWLEAMVRHACRPEVGAVGAKLVYGDGRLQHAGVVVGLAGRAGHILRRRPGDTPGHLGRLRVAHEVSAVTAACIAVTREKYRAVGGFDAISFPVDFNDVDFCLRLRAAGWKTVWTPAATLAHLESVSRGPSVGKKRVRFEEEAVRFAERWRDVIRHDPFYHPALSLTTFGEDLE